MIADPDELPDPTLDEPRHLGTLRHSILPWTDSADGSAKWLLPLTVLRPDGKYPGVRLYDPATKALSVFPALSPGHAGAHPALEHPILMVSRSKTTGALLAMGMGNSGHNLTPPELPSAAPVLHQAGPGHPWVEVTNFPASVLCPPGVALADWDDDGGAHGAVLHDSSHQILYLKLNPPAASSAQTGGGGTSWGWRTVG